VREPVFTGPPPRSAPASLAACLAAILELPLDEVPAPVPDESAAGWDVMRWLGGMGLGLVPVADAASFSWAGPWIGWVEPPPGTEHRAVVMFGVPSGVVWDPCGVTRKDGWSLEGGFVVSVLDVALARPPQPEAPRTPGTVEAIFVAAGAGAPARRVQEVPAVAGKGLEGDRHAVGKGTFPSGPPGSALTLIEAEVCESFAPPLEVDEHRRNIVTRGIDLNALVGHEFQIGTVRCRGVRLCEPCTVIDGYASRPILRALVHRGGLRADILEDGVIRAGDEVGALSPRSRPRHR
jgi:MOSC domain-containing protein YiiM